MLKKLKATILNLFKSQKSYSQDGEDTALAAFYEGKKGYRGFFVDVGAHHPIRFSNTLLFYKRGWRGINIDPTPGSMRLFRWFRWRDLNLEIGIGGQAGKLNFHCFNEPALNTFDDEVARQRNTGKPYRITQTIEVPIFPLAEILEKHLPHGQKIDFLSIDVEGLDLMVLKSNDWQKFSPDFVLVEDVHFEIENPTGSEIYLFLKAKGYKIAAVLKRTLIFQLKN